MSDQIDHIAELEKRLYARDPDAVPKRTFGILRPLRNDTDSAWGQEGLPKNVALKQTKVSPYKKLFIGSFLFFLIGVGVAVFSIYRGAITLSSRNVEITVLGNSFVGGGETLPVQVAIANKNSGDLLNTTLTLSYPRGASTLPGDIERIKKELGSIPSGKTRTEAFSVILYGEQGTSRDIVATLEYKLAGSNATFVREKTFSVIINASPVTLVVDGPTAIGKGQPFRFTVRTAVTGDATLQNTIARVEYPNGFTFLDATPKPTIGTQTWDLRDMVEGTERSITIRGRLDGEVQDEKAFRVYIGERTSDDDARMRVSYNSTLYTMRIMEPFMSARIVINGADTDVVALPIGSAVEGVVRWENTSISDIETAQISLSVPETVAPESIDAAGSFFDALTRTIVWDAQSLTSLARLSPGASGQLPFRFTVRGGQSGTDIPLTLSVKGMFPERSGAQEVIEGIDQKTVRFASRLQFATQALYSAGPIKNTGPFPPKADKDTTYTVVWTLRPTDNALTGTTVEALLPEGVEWTGTVAPQQEAVTFDVAKRLVVWNAGPLPRATSTPQVKTVAFQVRSRPTKAQIGSELELVGETLVRATDSVVNVPLSITRPALTTRLGTDPVYSPGEEKVLP